MICNVESATLQNYGPLVLLFKAVLCLPSLLIELDIGVLHDRVAQ